MPDFDGQNEFLSRLVRIETHLESMSVIALCLKTDTEKASEKINVKIDKILNNDTDKIQRIAVLETKTKIMVAICYVFGVALIGLLGNLIVKLIA